MGKCKGFMGFIFGHSWWEAWEEAEQTKKRLNLKSRVFTGTVILKCVRCGAVKSRKSDD